LVQYTQTYPERYGGSKSTGPSLSYNPTWSTQDPTATPTVTGEQVVAAFLDPLHQQGYWLSNALVRCMINGGCGVAPVRSALATIYARGLGETWSPATFEAWLAGMADGVTSPANSELWSKAKPYSWNAKGAVGYDLTTSQETLTHEPGTIRLSPQDLEAAWVLQRSFIAAYFDANPEQGCGSALAANN